MSVYAVCVVGLKSERPVRLKSDIMKALCVESASVCVADLEGRRLLRLESRTVLSVPIQSVFSMVPIVASDLTSNSLF